MWNDKENKGGTWRWPMPPALISLDESKVGEEEEAGTLIGAGACDACVGEGFIGLLPPADGVEDEGDLSEFVDMF